MTTDELEIVLEYFYLNRRYQKIEEIHKNVLKDLPILDLLIVINKLVKDGYITAENQKTTTRDGKTQEIKDVTWRYSYFINFDGVLFFEQTSFMYKRKPYKNKNMIRKIQATYNIAKIIMIVLNAVAIIILTYLAIDNK